MSNKEICGSIPPPIIRNRMPRNYEGVILYPTCNLEVDHEGPCKAWGYEWHIEFPYYERG